MFNIVTFAVTAQFAAMVDELFHLLLQPSLQRWWMSCYICCYSPVCSDGG